jgi:2-oxo-hept-3-ene-1,7-dioate hydratase
MSLAEDLDIAYREHNQIAPFGDVLTLESAYAVQAEFVSQRARRLSSRRVGYKVALTSPEAQAALRTDQPASGGFLSADIIPSGGTIRIGERFQPLLEVELVFRARTDLPRGASLAEIAERCEVTAGLECPDSRFREWFGGSFPALTLTDVVADNCLAGLLVVSDQWVAATITDLSAVTAELFIGPDRVKTGSGAEVLGNPLRAVFWLAEQLASRGEPVTAGTLISAGTFTAPVVARVGAVRGVFSGGLGEVRATFV